MGQTSVIDCFIQAFRMRTGVLLLVLALSQLALPGCGRPVGASRLSTVDIPQTAIKAQNKIGFCWSYATMGFLESLALQKSRVTVDLSEEALGFYRMAEELLALSRKYTAAELANADMVAEKSFEGLEGWDVSFNPSYNPGFPARNALQLVEDFGVVPESDWSYKFTSSEQTEKFFAALFGGFAALMSQHGQDHVTEEMIFSLLASADVYGSRPPEEFTYTAPDGAARQVSARGFVSDVIGFKTEDFTYMIPDGVIDYDRIVKAMKITLARGINVPLSYTIYEGAINRWDASHTADHVDPDHPEIDGGHVVLATDFVNKGGRPGAVADDVLRAELAKSPRALDFVVVKNSWNTRPQSPRLRLPGYYTMDQGYLRILSRKETDISIVVPRDIAFAVRYDEL